LFNSEMNLTWEINMKETSQTGQADLSRAETRRRRKGGEERKRGVPLEADEEATGGEEENEDVDVKLPDESEEEECQDECSNGQVGEVDHPAWHSLLEH